MKRREFIGLIGAAAWPLSAYGQQQIPLIGFLSSRSQAESADLIAAFRNGLQETGFNDGKNAEITFRWADGRYERLQALAAELISRRVAVLFAAGGPPSAIAAKRATLTIPVVFSATSNPVRLGLVESLNRPGGNVTGMSTFVTDLAGKSIQLLKDLLPGATTVSYLMNPVSPNYEIIRAEAQVAAERSGMQLHVLHASKIEEALALVNKRRSNASLIMGEPFLDSQRNRIVELSSHYRLVSCFPWREYVLAGGLMSYGNSLPDLYRQGGVYTGRILKGERPADLPVMQPTKFELVINLKAAKALGVEIPPTLLARADEVIE